MPSFLAKVFGRKTKDDEVAPGRPSDGSLLEGKFEEISPTVSPTANTFPESHGRDKENGRFSLFRLKSNPSPTLPSQRRVEDNVPHLSLNIPGRKDGNATPSPVLGVAFEANLDAHVTLSDSVIGERRLNPAETLKLVRACSQSITARGLETLGIMHPHWYSASPDFQRKLISLFIQSLDSKTTPPTLTSSSSTSQSPFEVEISFARSPHDVAAVLRWGLRHLQLDGGSFGKDTKWYENFSEAEKSSDYNSKAFTEKLVPQLPPAHLELLTTTLELVSSIAAHAEANGSSGSKLSKVLGFWLLTVHNSDKDNGDWNAFYSRWERAGRELEHLLLSRIRDEALRMPKRLQELVKGYPYAKYAVEGDDLLPRPRFSTRRYDALLVRVDTEIPPSGRKGKQHPLRLIEKAFKSEPSSSGSDGESWDKIRKAALDTEGHASPEGYPPLSRIFADETVRFLSLLPTDARSTRKQGPAPLGFSLAVPSPKSRPESSSRPQSMISLALNGAVTNGNAPSDAALTTPLPTSPVTTDWAAFSSAGFGESKTAGPLASTLLDKDLEKTQPAARKSIKKRKSPVRPGRNGVSTDTPRSPGTNRYEDEDEKDQKPSQVSVSLIQLDEAFIDFWSDALLDPISTTWPAFVICKLKPLPGVGSQVSWLVIEQTYKSLKAAPTSQQLSPTAETQKRSGSPRPSAKSGKSFGSKKRFTFFGRSQSTSSDKSRKKKGGKEPKIGEMGEILSEEPENTADKEGDGGITDVTAAAVKESKTESAGASVPAPIESGLNGAAEPKPSGTEPAREMSESKSVGDETGPSVEPVLSAPSPEEIKPEPQAPAHISDKEVIPEKDNTDRPVSSATKTSGISETQGPPPGLSATEVPSSPPLAEVRQVSPPRTPTIQQYAPKEPVAVERRPSPPVDNTPGPAIEASSLPVDKVSPDIQPVVEDVPQAPIAHETIPEPLEPVIEPSSQHKETIKAAEVPEDTVAVDKAVEIDPPVHHVEEAVVSEVTSSPPVVEESVDTVAQTEAVEVTSPPPVVEETVAQTEAVEYENPPQHDVSEKVEEYPTAVQESAPKEAEVATSEVMKESEPSTVEVSEQPVSPEDKPPAPVEEIS